MDPKPSSPPRAAFNLNSISVAARITFFYLVSGFLWILFSDQVLLLATQDVDRLSELQTYKGWFYVFITAGLLFLLVRHYFRIIEAGKEELKLSYDATLEGWVRALDLRDQETEGHTMRVTELAQTLARRIGLPEEDVEIIRVGAMLHDIGKMAIPDHILQKPGLHSAEEQALLRRHPIIGHDLLADSPSPCLRMGAVIALGHHENHDGSGYPHGLSGERIALPARIVAVADVFDTLTTASAHHSPWSLRNALDHLLARQGRQFDPECVRAFERQSAAVAEVMSRLRDGPP